MLAGRIRWGADISLQDGPVALRRAPEDVLPPRAPPGPMKAHPVARPAEVLRLIDRDEVARLTSELVRFPTVNPPGEERQIAEFIASWLEKRHIDASLLEEVPGRTNVEALVEGELPGGKTLVLNGHTDVVPAGNGWTRDPFGGEVAHGRVYGRGAADMKGGLAAMMVAAAALRGARARLAGRLVLQAAADEEVGGPIGTGYMVRRGLRADLAIVGEPTDLEVCVCHKGVIRFEVTVFGRSAHSSVPWEGESAILAMNVIVDAFRRYGERLARGRAHPLLGVPTVNVGLIQGGVAVNFVPDRCTIVAERRLVPPETVEGEVRAVEELVASAAKKAHARYELVFRSRSMSSDASAASEKIAMVLDAAGKVRRRHAVAKGFLATCDARFLSNDAGIPTFVFGPGRLANVHAPDEFVETSQLERAARVYALSYLGLQAMD